MSFYVFISAWWMAIALICLTRGSEWLAVSVLAGCCGLFQLVIAHLRRPE